MLEDVCTNKFNLMSPKAQVNKNPSFMAFRRKFSLKMLIVSSTLLDTVRRKIWLL